MIVRSSVVAEFPFPREYGRSATARQVAIVHDSTFVDSRVFGRIESLWTAYRDTAEVALDHGSPQLH